MTTTVNFDELAQKAFAPEATTDDYEKLFAAVFSLDAWYFIADEEFQRKLPYCAPFPNLFGDAPALTVFTDGERARKFIAEGGLKGGAAVSDSPEDLIMNISTTNILDFLDKLAPLGVVKIFFNPDKDSRGFHHDLKMMRPIYEHLKGKNLLAKPAVERIESPVEKPEQIISSGVNFDELSRKIHRVNPPMEDLNELFGAAFALESWEFIARGEMPNVNPYVASHPDTADNQPMIRAFTDGTRLQRFAKENNLLREDGSVDALTIPTRGIVEYLEQFISNGVHGIWFNSDSESDGFFIPLKQLRPIKEHLAKIKPTATETEFTVLIVTITDGLMLPSGFVKQSSYNCNFFCWLPREWTENLQLKPEYLEKLYEQFYGANWRSGNSDGSRYVVTESNSAVMSPERVKDTKWNIAQNNELNHYWYYIGEPNDAFKKVSADEFQKKFDASFQTATDETRRQQDNLANWGLSETPDGDFDLNLNINQVGAVNFETSIAPFYEAIVPLLENYQGSGEYVSLLRFEPSGKSQEVENIAENSHGAYLQIRRFLYLNPKNNTRIGVNSIHSSRLRHVQSNAELLVSIELCKNLDNQTAVFYHAFQGPKSDVLNLAAAIQPLLESVGYDPVQ